MKNALVITHALTNIAKIHVQVVVGLMQNVMLLNIPQYAFVSPAIKETRLPDVALYLVRYLSHFISIC